MAVATTELDASAHSAIRISGPTRNANTGSGGSNKAARHRPSAEED